jgi:hypothetical protein
VITPHAIGYPAILKTMQVSCRCRFSLFKLIDLRCRCRSSLFVRFP